jgi:hypothetical protein
MKKLIPFLSLSLLALTVGAPTGSVSNGNSLQRSDSQLKPLPALARLNVLGGPRLVYDDSLEFQGQVQSLNWSGYAALGAAAGSVTTVSGSWIVNPVTGSSGQYAAVWVGIDGYDSSTVEQLGTLAEITTTGFGRNAKTVVEYYAWYEMYPAGMYQIPLSITPGDSITASVTWTPGTTSYKLYMIDNTSGKSWSGTFAGSSKAEQNSAEWIVEAPASNSGILPLADFGTEPFSACSATIGNTTGSISTCSAGDYEEITMVYEQQQGRKETVTVEAQPSGLDTTGSIFGDTWESSGPTGFSFGF